MSITVIRENFAGDKNHQPTCAQGNRYRNRGPGLVAGMLLCTGVCLRADIPYVATYPASSLKPTSAVLNGGISPDGLPTTAWFQWGTNRNYGNESLLVDLGSGTNVIMLTNLLTDLTTPQDYHFRVVASNSAGIAFGPDQAFGFGKRIKGWGTFSTQLTNVPAGASNIVAFAGGDSHSVALRDNGRVLAWGDQNFYGETNVPTNLSNVVAVAAGGGWHSLALKNDGKVVAWGRNSFNQTNVPPGLTNVLSIAAGNYHSLALLGDGHVVSWGGPGPFLGDTNIPPGLSNVVAISAGEHSMALRRDGTVVAWGNSMSGETNVPAGLSNVVAIAAGDNNSVALKSDGTVVVWGNNSYGQTNVPAGLSNVVVISAGNSHILALKENGEVVAWGNPGALLTSVPVLNHAISVVAASRHNLALIDNSPPQASSNTVTIARNTTSSFILGATDDNRDALSARITVLPSSGTLLQSTNGVAGTPILTTNTLVTDPGRRVYFRPATNAFGSPYTSFQFTIYDGTHVSEPATVVVNVSGPPEGITSPPELVTDSTAVLKGEAKANLRSTDVWFEWGNTTNYGNVTASSNIGTNAVFVPVQTQIEGLTPLTTYHYRVVASNFFGVALGQDVAFVALRSSSITNWVKQENGQWRFEFDGFSNTTYTVWSSTNLNHWSPAGPASQTTPGKFFFQEEETNHLRRFYQLRWP